MPVTDEPTKHARLGPSSAHRWINCPGSLRMSEHAVRTDEGSPWATEGTIAHSLGEILARRAMGESVDHMLTAWEDHEFYPEYGEYPAVHKEMMVHAQGYADFIFEQSEFMDAETYFFEERVETGIPEVWGTADAILVSEKTIHVIDFKYGSGVPVSAERNPQLLLYGLGAMRKFHPDAERVIVSVYQPRVRDGVSSYSVTSQWLQFWADEVVAPAAREALSSHGHLAPSASNCRWCPAAGFCKARAAMELRHDFGTEPEMMKGKDIAEVLPKLPDIQKWIEQVKANALLRAEFEDIPGYRVEQGRGTRKILDSDGAIDRLQEAGYDFDQIASVKVNGITALKKVMEDGDDLDTLLGDTLGYTGGGPKLVRDKEEDNE